MILGPPLAPRAATNRPWLSCTRVGDIELKGFLPGLMKLGALGAKPYVFSCSGVLKSSIWLFNMNPAHRGRGAWVMLIYTLLVCM